MKEFTPAQRLSSRGFSRPLPKQRLDTLLVNLNFTSSRQKAQRLIRAGEVKVDGQLVDKPGTEVNPSAQIQLKEKLPYVSRGGEKLAKALEVFAIPVAGRICLDAGISTGGFTDCLLQAGARRVYGIDVGYGQVAWSLRQDERVVLRERTNFRHLQSEELYESESPAELAVADVSFISLTKIIDPLWNLLVSPREAVLLVKPQFEVGREYYQNASAAQKGVVRNSTDHSLVILQVVQAAQQLGWQACGLTWSPVTGAAGNIEYLLWLSTDCPPGLTDIASIQSITAAAIAHLSKK